MLTVCEIFFSLQGESTQSGRLCAFVRLRGCNLRCVWCDTAYAYTEPGKAMSVDGVVAALEKFFSGGASGAPRLVEITGGEPLLQPEVPALCERLLGAGYEVMVETNGSLDISVLPEGVRRIVDVKCPGSGSGGSFFIDNLRHICAGDEVKFVLASIGDAAWADGFCRMHRLAERCAVIFSPVPASLPYSALAEWMAENRTFGARLGVQLHKVIWGDRRSV
ncbi:MAG: radical SAM protein [Chitinispirillales bacterium]|jgi:7-carboxy-7-deazaguanine synthase|nr:radical SAM protein [Chitinispirillales bacterium]